MAKTESFQIQVTPGLRVELEAAADCLNLSVAAYILYLHKRAAAGGGAERLDRHVKEVFGKHGNLMRRLAK